VLYALIALKPQHHKITPSLNNVMSKYIANDDYGKSV